MFHCTVRYGTYHIVLVYCTGPIDLGVLIHTAYQHYKRKMLVRRLVPRQQTMVSTIYSHYISHVNIGTNFYHYVLWIILWCSYKEALCILHNYPLLQGGSKTVVNLNLFLCKSLTYIILLMIKENWSINQGFKSHGMGCPDFPMEWDAPLTRSIPTLGIGNISRCSNQDVGTLTR